MTSVLHFRRASLLAILLACVLACVCAFGVKAGISQAQPQTATAQSNDAWHFPDEDAEGPGWIEDLKDQAADLAFLTAFATLALVGFFRKSEPLKYVTMAVSVVYLGFARSQLITVVNIFALTRWNLPEFRHNLAWYLFAIFTVGTTLLWGRLYCGRVCAFGSMTQLMDRIVPPRLRIEIPRRIDQKAAYIKYGLLAAAVLYFLVTNDILIYRYIEPFWMFTRAGTAGMWIGLTALLIATIFVRNVYCRFLCPVGAFLGLLSNVTIFRIKRWSECDNCKICEKKCEWGAIRGPKIVASECVRCDDCERLYMDQQKCPHWLILRKKSREAARRV